MYVDSKNNLLTERKTTSVVKGINNFLRGTSEVMLFYELVCYTILLNRTYAIILVYNLW